MKTYSFLKCNNCGAEINPGMKECPSCGVDVDNSEFCVLCGTKHPHGTETCPQCGSVLIPFNPPAFPDKICIKCGKGFFPGNHPMYDGDSPEPENVNFCLECSGDVEEPSTGYLHLSENLASANPDKAEKLSLLALRILLADGDTASASEVCRKTGDRYARKGNYPCSVGWYKKCIELNPGNEEALHDLSHCYLNGQGIEQSYREAVDLLVKAKDIKGAAEVALTAAAENNKKKIYEIALKWYQEVLTYDPKNIKAMKSVASYHQKGLGGAGDLHKAVELYCQAGVPAEAVTVCLKAGQDASGKDDTQAVEWYQRALEIDPDEKKAAKLLGDCCFKGKGIDQNFEKAFELYQKSGNKSAAIACCQEAKKQAGKNDQQEKACLWAGRLIELDPKDKKTILLLAENYKAGKGVVQNFAKAAAFYQQAGENDTASEMFAKAGDQAFAAKKFMNAVENYKKLLKISPKDANALKNLADIYENGKGVDADPAAAGEFYELLGDKPQAALCFFKAGKEALDKKKYKTAGPLFEKSMTLGELAGAQHGLASCFASDSYKKYDKAVEHCKAAAEKYLAADCKEEAALCLQDAADICAHQGNEKEQAALLQQILSFFPTAAAQRDMAMFYASGKNVEKDMEKALSLLKEAGKTFHEAKLEKDAADCYMKLVDLCIKGAPVLFDQEVLVYCQKAEECLPNSKEVRNCRKKAEAFYDGQEDLKYIIAAKKECTQQRNQGFIRAAIEIFWPWIAGFVYMFTYSAPGFCDLCRFNGETASNCLFWFIVAAILSSCAVIYRWGYGILLAYKDKRKWYDGQLAAATMVVGGLHAFAWTAFFDLTGYGTVLTGWNWTALILLVIASILSNLALFTGDKEGYIAGGMCISAGLVLVFLLDIPFTQGRKQAVIEKAVSVFPAYADYYAKGNMHGSLPMWTFIFAVVAVAVVIAVKAYVTDKKIDELKKDGLDKIQQERPDPIDLSSGTSAPSNSSRKKKITSSSGKADFDIDI